MELVIDNLACRRGGRLIFRGLAFRVPAGTAAAVRGPNAVGKSTLLRQLAGLIPVAGGDARLDGVSLAGDPGAFQERVAYAGHADAVKPALTVAENLDLWTRLHGTDPDRAEAALARFGLAHVAGRPAAECSAGQKRRLGLARLTVSERPLWLMDEPTVSLDAEAAGVVAALVRAHVAAGGLALIATHVDLGLGEIPVLEMRPPGAEAERHEDPFLAGVWS